MFAPNKSISLLPIFQCHVISANISTFDLQPSAGCWRAYIGAPSEPAAPTAAAAAAAVCEKHQLRVDKR